VAPWRLFGPGAQQRGQVAEAEAASRVLLARTRQPTGSRPSSALIGAPSSAETRTQPRRRASVNASGVHVLPETLKVNADVDMRAELPKIQVPP